MYHSHRGQAQAITVVLLTGLTVATASVVYVWGQPILDKRQAQNDLDSVEQKTINLRQEIQRVSEAGQGASGTVSFDLSDSEYEVQLLQVNEGSDYIDIVVNSGNAPYPDGKWTILKPQNEKVIQNLSIGSGDYATKGEDSGSVLMAKSRASSVRYRVEFRNLHSKDSSTPLEKVDIRADGGSVSGGGSEVSLTNLGTREDRGDEGLRISSGQRLDRSRTVISVDLR
jgi:hypothetical protein